MLRDAIRSREFSDADVLEIIAESRHDRDAIYIAVCLVRDAVSVHRGCAVVTALNELAPGDDGLYPCFDLICPAYEPVLRALRPRQIALTGHHVNFGETTLWGAAVAWRRLGCSARTISLATLGLIHPHAASLAVLAIAVPSLPEPVLQAMARDLGMVVDEEGRVSQ